MDRSTYVGSPRGNTDYQSLQFTMKKRAAHGLSMLASYNLSSSHGDVDDSFEELYYTGPLQDVYNLRQERHTISDFDQTHIVKGYVLYRTAFWSGQSVALWREPRRECVGGRMDGERRLPLQHRDSDADPGQRVLPGDQ